MAKTPAAPQVPGAIPPAADPAPSTAPDPTQPVASPLGAPAADADTVAVPKAQLDALLAKMADLEAKAAAAPAAAARPAKTEGENLPDQSSVNPDAIKSPVLTKQGWVVPTDFGANPAAKRL